MLISLITMTASAQNDVTKFLGIPVDGTKSEMIRKLKAKGFTSSSFDKDILVGEFNGYSVNIHIITNNNKVSRIMVADQNSISETDIKIRFNNLCNQFLNNKNYIENILSDSAKDFIISNDENLQYETIVNKKRYEAVFHQMPDTIGLKAKLQTKLQEKYTPEQLENPTKEMEDFMFSCILNFAYMKPVWFMISNNYGKYYICMFYDNEYNRANGEDL